ncbi:anti-sigma factor [Bacillus sp. FJAT-27225]|uniref:anti-sigma factor n=1 Tax=Bacillus sp. FJAT-27225 TaxID=1743144 RepID=UPI00080C30CA|nr:anti-sigma factor [Bacillus sp. FJAT-27225]OCA87528.1 anti-sigma factor [Bacillus sp. FJAT-27225]
MKDKDKNNKSDVDIYTSFINESINEFEKTHAHDEKEQKRIVQRSKHSALLTNILISLALLLLIVPVMTLGTYLYYVIGGKANNLIEVASKTIYVTEPNMSLEEMELEEDIGFFSMTLTFDVFKRIGKEDYKAGEYEIYHAFDKPSFPKRNMLLDRPMPEISTQDPQILVHPDAPAPLGRAVEWNILEGLPDGTVAEVYLSLNELLDPEEVKNRFGDDIEVRWLAVDTGFEAKQLDQEGVPVSPIGYPAQVDQTTWSPFNGRDHSNEEVFMDILELLEKNEETATIVSSSKSLVLTERIEYLKANGIHVYGAVVTGPVPALRTLENDELVRSMKVGEVKLWNWK